MLAQAADQESELSDGPALVTGLCALSAPDCTQLRGACERRVPGDGDALRPAPLGL